MTGRTLLESEVGEWTETVFTEWYRELADAAAQALVWSWKAGKSRSSNTMVLTGE